ncbi:M48 family metalloprotease [Nitrosococcus wardiae]|uniref:Peptidase M48 n=1 Tax=Nitrosococcus wardiae TaxID=1814290 RepID=A0A4P7BXH8_9GAMM|nr:M48 family metalloprotease [Nitrosococcus wardiae]QBQ54017.1 peptidase M48 [Nitrosococcus wardiae]
METKYLLRQVGALVLCLCVATACAVNPVTGERQLVLISEAQEIQLGRQGAEQIRQTMALVEDDELQAYVDRLGQQLAADSERPHLPWAFAVVDDPTPNAFALPGGFIFVTRGMLTLMDSEAELVAVLGHEIGHVTARHSVTQLSRAQLAQLGLGLGAIIMPEIQLLGDIAGLGLNLLFLKYGRDAERQADTLGFRYARAEGYDVAEMADIFASLQRAGELAGQSPVPSWLATHPAPEERVEAVEARLRQLPENPFDATVGRAEFLNMIDGLPYGPNPRNGFFRGNTFYHPGLAFQLAVPEGWQRQNMAQAVVGVNSAQNAAFQLTLAGTDSAAEALQRFASQEGVQTERGAREDINGLPALIARFQAQGQQETVGGYVAFFEYGGRTYQLLGYTPAQLFAEYQRLFQNLITSFAPITEASILNIKPPVIEIVRLPEAMSLAQFHSRSASDISLEQLALINQVQNTDAVISQGTLLKRVRGRVADVD